MPRRTETAYFVPETSKVEVLSRGAYVSLIAWSAYGVYHEIYVDNDELIFTEDNDLDAM